MKKSKWFLVGIIVLILVACLLLYLVLTDVFNIFGKNENNVTEMNVYDPEDRVSVMLNATGEGYSIEIPQINVDTEQTVVQNINSEIREIFYNDAVEFMNRSHAEGEEYQVKYKAVFHGDKLGILILRQTSPIYGTDGTIYAVTYDTNTKTEYLPEDAMEKDGLNRLTLKDRIVDAYLEENSNYKEEDLKEYKVEGIFEDYYVCTIDLQPQDADVWKTIIGYRAGTSPDFKDIAYFKSFLNM